MANPAPAAGNAANTLQLLSALPACYGRAPNGRPKKGESPETFLQSLELHFHSIDPHMAPVQKIALVTRNLRGECRDWWLHQCNPIEGAPRRYEDRIQTDYDYFKNAFKEYFFSITDTSGLTQDISDVVPAEGELIAQYLDRLLYTIRPVTAEFQKRTARRTAAVNFDNLRNEDLVNALRDLYPVAPAAGGPVPDPVIAPQDTLIGAIRAFVTRAAAHAANLAVFDAEYFNIAQVAARNIKQDFMRTTIRKHMHVDDMDLTQLKMHATTAEKARTPNARFASTLVNEIDVAEIDDASQAPPADGDSGESDSATDDEYGAPVNYAQRSGYRGKKARGKGPPSASRKAKAGSAATPTGKWCEFCQSATHNTSECRSMKAARELWLQHNPPKPRRGKGKKDGGAQQQQQQQQHAGQQPGGAQGGQSGHFNPFPRAPAYQHNRPTPMDVDHTQAAALQAEAQSYYDQAPQYFAPGQPTEN